MIEDPDTHRYGNNCGADMSYYQRYLVPVAAALWCGVLPENVQQIIDGSREVGRAIYRHHNIRCLEPKCRAIHEAIDNKELPVYREQGGSVGEHVAPERRHVSRKELKEWITARYPNERPPTLFDDMERNTHDAITTEAYQTLQADRDALKMKLEKAEERVKKAITEKNDLLGERDSLRAMVEKMNTPGDRAETTYLNLSST